MVEQGAAQLTAKQQAEADRLFATMTTVISGLQQTFGPTSEIVLHDYRQPEHSAIAVAGKVTDRAVGSPMSEIGLSLMRQGDAAEDKLNYLIRLPGGRVVKSSTMLLRITGGRVVGALCVNVDVTEVRRVARLLTEFSAGGEQAATPTPISTFGNDVSQVIDAALDKVERDLDLGSLDRLSSAEWSTVFRALEELGVFQLRRGVPLVAERLGLSRASAYNYLARVREESRSPK
ncbi:helix-turn-helix transcriptional regulator [Labedaea rhizosphaerae]|uniref:Putative transcriptional regulator YheO n=1 Tax=Labedaea rhizosphaerae TaxID=598644 RepID=A0A4R6SEZ0_LABRH|nr:PAS domain-containing protein [Labedaea rhizosphaerae]TDQ00532.1 putative transcriptional regulator YheO [Labedaea rhizosphaerae]